MAFVSQADRGITAISRSLDVVGPGSYDIGKARHGNGYSCAPFWSTASRQNPHVETAPGPGAYSNPNSGWPHTITTYSNSNNIIIKLNTLGTPPFQSKIPRFPQDSFHNPGPADYLVPTPAHQGQRKPRIKSNKLFNATTNTPSIAKVNYLSERRVKTEETPIAALPSKKGVLAGVWGKDKCKRFVSKCVTEVGPGTYDLPAEPQRSSKKGVSGSNPFLSNTVRTFDTIVYETRNAETLAMRKLQNYCGQKPAPGSYNLASFKSSEPPEYKNHTFGSTRQRFVRSKTEEAVPFYEVDSSFQTQNFHKKSVPFNSESKKMAETATASALPGPGYYSLDRRGSFMARRSIQCFGSTAKRSLEAPKGNDKLGPGCYEPVFRHVVELQQSSCFASKQARSFQVSPKPDKKFAAYEVVRGDISQKAHQERLHRHNLQKINCAKPAFDRQTPRFAHYEDEQEQVPKKLTSQQVEFLMRQRREEERERGIEAARKQAEGSTGGAMGRGVRFKEGRGGPGVGDYALRSNWTKKSYNIKYSLGQ